MRLEDVDLESELWHFRYMVGDLSITEYIEAPSWKEALERANAIGVPCDAKLLDSEVPSWRRLGNLTQHGWATEYATWIHKVYRLNLDDGRVYYYNGRL